MQSPTTDTALAPTIAERLSLGATYPVAGANPTTYYSVKPPELDVEAVMNIQIQDLIELLYSNVYYYPHGDAMFIRFSEEDDPEFLGEVLAFFLKILLGRSAENDLKIFPSEFAPAGATLKHIITYIFLGAGVDGTVPHYMRAFADPSASEYVLKSFMAWHNVMGPTLKKIFDPFYELVKDQLYNKK